MKIRLKNRRRSFHFCRKSSDIYNPYSLFQALEYGEIKPYWFESGTPMFIINKLKKSNIAPSDLDNLCLDISEFDIPVEESKSAYPLLYQSGYITINKYDGLTANYTLGIPNDEVRVGLFKDLITNYISADYTPNSLINKMSGAVLSDDIDGAFRLLQTFLGTVPYCRDTQYEGHYQQMLYIIFTLLGAQCDVENHTARGRIDMTLKNAHRIFVIEIKVDESAVAALDQIEEKRYADRFALDTLPVTKVGVNFSTTERNITEWQIVNC